MGLSRRSFLGLFELAASGLFVPVKTIFLPPAGGWRSPTTGIQWGIFHISTGKVESHQEFAARIGSERQPEADPSQFRGGAPTTLMKPASTGILGLILSTDTPRLLAKCGAIRCYLPKY